MMMGRLSKLLQIVSGGSSAGLGIRKSAGKQIGQLLSGSEDPAPVLSVLQQVHLGCGCFVKINVWW